jgi:DeoR/GlpR family transcriptional regulator of sugar metabolism
MEFSMKNLSLRQQEILKLVATQGFLSVEDIQKAIGISQATVYREFQALAQMGLVTKTSGGIGKVEVSSAHCVQCRKEINLRVAFLFELKDGKQASACCPHCGFMALSRRTDIKTAMATDFLHGLRLSARQAFYVVSSDVSLCCHPSVLSFSNRNDASRFAQGFGGDVMDFVDAQNSIQKIMAL